MVSALKCVLAVAIIASIACSAYAVHCYQCESITNPRCGENFESDDAFKFNCDSVAPPRFLQTFLQYKNATGCMKKTMENISGRPQIIRSCYFGDVSNTQSGCQSDPSLPFVKQLSCNVCTGNLCNTSSTTVPIFGAILLFLILARIMS